MKIFYHFICAVPHLNRQLWPVSHFSEEEAKKLAVSYEAGLLRLTFDASGDMVNREVLLKMEGKLL